MTIPTDEIRLAPFTAPGREEVVEELEVLLAKARDGKVLGMVYTAKLVNGVLMSDKVGDLTVIEGMGLAAASILDCHNKLRPCGGGGEE